MWDELKRLTTTMGIVLPDNAPTLFAQYYSFLVEQNKYVNLTRITETREVMIKHFLDSLALLVKLPLVREKVLDIGSGAGLPGIPLKVACPGLSLTLLDSSQKRVDFLQAVTSHLALGMVQAHHGRAEDYGKQSNFRDKYEVVVSRAVAQLAVLTELCLPFVAVGGFFVAYKGPDALEEVGEAEYVLAELGGMVEKLWIYDLPEGFGKRTLVIIKKVKETPTKYPRKAGIPTKRPLLAKR